MYPNDSNVHVDDDGAVLKASTIQPNEYTGQSWQTDENETGSQRKEAVNQTLTCR